eukprot:7275381-Prymnesium_polylepis.1
MGEWRNTGKLCEPEARGRGRSRFLRLGATLQPSYEHRRNAVFGLVLCFRGTGRRDADGARWTRTDDASTKDPQ